MRSYLILVFLLHNTLGIWSQNLVLNPSFENPMVCIGNPFLLDSAKHWQSLLGCSADRYCEGRLINHGIPLNLRGYQFARTGHSYSGAIIASPRNAAVGSNEYLEGQLEVELSENEEYYAEFHLSLSDKSKYAIDKIGLFVTSEIDSSKATFNQGNTSLYYDAEPQVESGQIIDDTATWVKISNIFTASGGEKKLIIGNFRRNWSGEYSYKEINLIGATANYYIDDVSIIHIKTNLPDTVIICYGQDTLISGEVDSLLNASYLWNTGSRNPSIIINSSGDYVVEINIDNHIYLDSVYVHVLPSTIDLGNDTTICAEDDFILKIENEFNEFTWSNGYKGRIMKIHESGLYKTVVRNKCGEFFDEIEIEVTSCDCHNYIPNAFTPNNDGVNDVFVPIVSCESSEISYFQMRIFNRWGEIVFVNKNDLDGWDGLSEKGRLCNMGVYVYQIIYTISKPNGKQENIILTGDITLLN